ncbi:uncharacterized protein LOC114362469 [Ostrinia furnacalis]|uniref:uncharacterized protein LOC114362469 n=1 Tax=Ostrinia furnacalis TaxID=93504 RepID=UPI001040D79A|nr:uncharacterized protein LOC114362469 [Ostrinia furnacalis]
MWDKLRKFGLQYCDLPTMLWNVCFMLRALTVSVDSRNPARIPIIFYIFTTVISACYFYVYLVSMVWFVFWKCRETGDVIAAMIVFSLGISSEIGPCKLFYMFMYEKVIKNIVDGYLACDAQTLKSDRFRQNLLKGLRVVKKRGLIFWMVIIGNGTIYIMKPIVTPGRHIMEDLFIIYGLEPMFESPNYEIGFLLTAGGVICTCYLPANITALLTVLIGYTEATMLALSEELVHLWSDAQEHYNKYLLEAEADNALVTSNDDIKNQIINKYIKQKLEEIVKIHTTNINLIQQIEHVFRGAIAVEFLLLITGLISELLGGLENTYIEMPFALMQVAMDCLTGQRMMDACDKFENSVYDCKWENFNVANMRTVLLMLQNAQKTMVLSAGGMTQLSFTCLMTVIRSIYSAYTTLRSMMA